MKKTTLILVLAVLALFTQCKKQENNGNGDGIQMVLKADNGGSKTNFGANGSISWNANEKIYVVTNGECVGYVTNGTEGGNTFTGILGRITESGTYDFHYYYLGNTKTIAAGATSFTMDFSNQDGTLAHLGDFHVGYGSQVGVEVTEGETVNAQATMRSLVSMAYFNTTGMAEPNEEVFFFGDNINNQLSVDFSTNVPTYSKVSDGRICTGTPSSGAYVMLVPNHTDGTEQLSTEITFASVRAVGTCDDVFSYGIVGGRFFCHEGNAASPITVTVSSYIPVGALRGVFSVSATDKVRFSQGNLQYIGSAGNGDDNNTGAYWKLAEEQWEYLGTTTGQFSDSKTVDRDLFGWGTSGYNHGATCYQPWCTSTDYSQYNPYNSTSTNLYDSDGQADWGYEAIVNGGNEENYWRTLTGGEWYYVFYTRTNALSKRGRGNVNGVNGMILLPDDWTLPEGLNFTSGNSNWVNVYTEEQWAQMEYNGAVFLPVSESREGMSLSVVVGYGFYWSSSYGDNTAGSGVRFDSSTISVQSFYRHYGFSVRLVRNVQ